MDAITLVVFVASIYPAGRIAERRGRSFKVWAWIAAFIGPLALPLVFLLPNLRANLVVAELCRPYLGARAFQPPVVHAPGWMAALRQRAGWTAACMLQKP
jgi:hypothetical protein